MIKNFRELAIAESSVSPLIGDRTKLSTADVIARYPDGFKIKDFDLTSFTDEDGQINEYCILLFNDDDSIYYCGGLLLTKIVKSWIGTDDITDVRESYKVSEPVSVKLSLARTKRNNNITKVEIL